VRYPRLPDDVWEFIDGLREEDVPEFLPTCPITLGVPRQPVQSPTSQTTYEYHAICDHLDHSDRSPSSDKRLTKADLVPDRSALRVIEGWARDQMQKDQNKRGSPPGGDGASKRPKVERGRGASAGAAAAAAGHAGGGEGEARKVIDLADDDHDDDEVMVTGVVLGRPPAGLLNAVNETVLTNMMQWFGELQAHTEPSDEQVKELKQVLSGSIRVERFFRKWVCLSVPPDGEAQNDDTYSRVRNGTFKTAVSAILRELFPCTT